MSTSNKANTKPTTVSEYRKYIYLEDLCPMLRHTFTDLPWVKKLAKTHENPNIRNFFQAYLEECRPEYHPKTSCPGPRKPKYKQNQRKRKS